MKYNGFRIFPVEVTHLQSVLLVGLLLVFSISCQEKPVEYFNRSYIQTFYHPDSSKRYITGDSTELIPAPDYSKRIFVVVDSNRLAYVQKGALTEVYKQYFPTVNFYDFMYDALNQKTVFSSRMIPGYIGHKFQLDESITNAFQTNGVDLLLKTYFEEMKQAYRLKSSRNEGQLLTILYYVFLSGYDIGFSDYQGSFYAYKRTQPTEIKRTH